MLITNIPKIIGNAKTLFIAKSDVSFDIVTRENKKILIKYVSVCQYEQEKGFYLFGCDNDFNTHTDFFYDELDEALQDAKRIYKTESIIWTQIS